MIATHPVERFFAQWEFEAPWLLGVSDAETMTVEQLLALEPGSISHLLGMPLGYAEPGGARPLRSEVAGLYELAGPDDVEVCAAGAEALLLCVLGLTEPGDHVIVMEPSYPTLAEMAREWGAAVSAWRLRMDDAWQPDLGELRGLLRPETRMLVVNFPHNPTGFNPSEESFRAIVGIAREAGLVLISDEMYRLYEYERHAALPAACDLYAQAVSVSGMSKVFGLAGVRLAWAVTRDPALKERLVRVHDYTTICNSSPSELLAALAIRHRDGIVERNRSLAVSNLALLEEFVYRHDSLFEWIAPSAGPVAFPRFLPGGAEGFCLDLVKDAGVLLLPGGCFGEPDHIRMGFGRSGFSEGLSCLDDYLSVRTE